MIATTYKRLLEELGEHIKDITYNVNTEKWEIHYFQADTEEYDTFAELFAAATEDMS